MIKKYKTFLESKQDIHSICKKYKIENYTINKDNSIDGDGDVDLYRKNLTKLPLKFNSVSRHFYCYNNQLTTLKGAPESVGGIFYCSYNKLTTLKGAPQSVGGDFYCSNNQLTTLKGAPQSVGSFNCRNNQLTTLEGAPQSVGGDFDCDNNLIYEIWKLFNDTSKIELFNDYDMIIDDYKKSGKPAVILDRLNSFLLDIGKEEVKKVKDYINI